MAEPRHARHRRADALRTVVRGFGPHVCAALGGTALGLFLSAFLSALLRGYRS